MRQVRWNHCCNLTCCLQPLAIHGRDHPWGDDSADGVHMGNLIAHRYLTTLNPEHMVGTVLHSVTNSLCQSSHFIAHSFVPSLRIPFFNWLKFSRIPVIRWYIWHASWWPCISCVANCAAACANRVLYVCGLGRRRDLTGGRSRLKHFPTFLMFILGTRAP